MRKQFGGTFAPPLSDELLSAYAATVNALPAGRLKEALNTLLRCCQAWWDLPESNGTASRRHPSGRGQIVDLSADHMQALWDLIPWSAASNGHGQPDELEAIQSLCDGIDPVRDRDLRNLAFHLLWHVKELDLDREPLTADQL